MDVMHSCRCCLRCPPDKDLTTPYTHLGKTEIYADLIKECFDIDLILNSSGSCGICSACVGRLRDASDFKLQVQRSQAELQAALPVKVEPAVKSELAVDTCGDSVFNVLHVNLIEKTEMVEEGTEEMLCEDPLVKPTIGTSDDVISGSNWTLAAPEPVKPAAARAKQQLARNKASHHEKKRTKRIKDTHETTSIKNNYAKTTHGHKEKKYCCETCGKEFKAKYLLVRHIRIHMSRERYPCNICDKSLLTHSDLKKHKMIHTGEKRYTCEECSLQFSQKGNLDRHRRIHTGERPFSCGECNKQFANKSNLDRHVKLHTGNKPYICEKCTKRFSQKGNLLIHKCIFINNG